MMQDRLSTNIILPLGEKRKAERAHKQVNIENALGGRCLQDEAGAMRRPRRGELSEILPAQEDRGETEQDVALPRYA